MIAVTLALSIFGLALLILLHEAGHFLAARLVGGVATRF
jgi:membrane-associated protease RseP (regulator of RpoE activity)